MSAPSSIAQAARALEEARAKGAHTVRINTNVLDILLGAHTILSAAFQEVDRKKNEANDA